MLIYIILALAVLVNGATDAANAITGVVSGSILNYRSAALLSAAFNFLGLAVFACFMPAVSETVQGIASGGIKEAGIVLATVVIFAGGAWLFSIPTSESHALIAAMWGCSAAVGKATDIKKLVIILFGAIVSALLGGLVSAVVCRTVPTGALTNKSAAIVGCIASSFLHGAQDGQKFLALAVSMGLLKFSWISVCLVAAVMFTGTLLGGRRIVVKLGEKMTKVDIKSAVASDAGSAAALLIVTMLGIPSSTTHTKTCAIAGAAAAEGEKVDKKELGGIVFGWILTFPACCFLAYFITKTINWL